MRRSFKSSTKKQSLDKRRVITNKSRQRERQDLHMQYRKLKAQSTDSTDRTVLNCDYWHDVMVATRKLILICELPVIHKTYDYQVSRRKIIQRTHHPVVAYLIDRYMEDKVAFLCTYGLAPTTYYDYMNNIHQIIDDSGIDINSEIGISTLLPKLIHKVSKNMNVLQASEAHLFILDFFSITDWFREMRNNLSNGDNLTRWHWYYHYSQVLNYDAMGSGHGHDLDERAEILYLRCQELSLKIPFHTKIRFYTMDGHGRLIARFIGLIIKHNPELLNRMEIQIYELNITNNTWHDITMPVGTANLASIFIPLQNDITDKIIYSSIYYLNFSGLSNQGDECYNLIAKASELAPLHGILPARNILISFSSDREGREPAVKLDRELRTIGFDRLTSRSYLEDHDYDSIGDFITMGIH